MDRALPWSAHPSSAVTATQSGAASPIDVSRAATLPLRRLILAASLFVAVSAVGGGAALVVWRAGDSFLPLAMLRYTPFTSFLVPGLILAIGVGGASLVCATLAWRRSLAAVDATILAGGVLTVWIVAEVAMLRGFHWLHALYGALGVALLGLGVHAVRRTGEPRHRWVVAVTLGEAFGFLVPACAGLFAARAGLGEAAGAALVVAAGFVEGLALGVGQALAFPLPVRGVRYAVLTSLAAGAVWACVMSVTVLAATTAVPPAVVVVAGVIAGVLGLVAIGAAQWVELRRHTRQAHRWIAWTAAAWLVALPWSFAPGPFVDESTPLASHLALWGSGGVIMAYVMALMTWQGARRLPAVAALLGSRGGSGDHDARP